MTDEVNAAEGAPTAKNSRDPSTRGPSKNGKGGRASKHDERARRSGSERRGIAGVPGSKNPERRCKATVFSTGLRCKRAAIKGGTVCTSHGGAAPQVQKSAKERLLELADPAIAALSKIVRDEDTDDAVRLRAALGVLDRIGYGPGQTIEVSTSKWESVLDDVFQGGVDRGSLAGPDDHAALPSGVGDSEDLDQAQHDAQAEAWRDLDNEDARDYESGRIRPDENTIVGSVVVKPAGGEPEGTRVRPARGA
ncbi:hypothetical protein QWJ41_19780 [Nocardioides sp. SOB44]|uniref:Uncharacterized protein n=1 Tax=Nocardioides cremeus TaxID=3058044 RepID=A0ABT8TVI7_9ACTN|nr:hypothetical protein [Nocardioides cremeus]MDO3397973.1 hypothetical protein [Nocardioides cremeus]